MRFIRAVTCFLLFFVAAFAQSDRGTITGTVSDLSGAVVPNASVIAVFAESGTEVPVATTETGNYTIASLRPGIYSLTVEAAGFKTYLQDVTLLADQSGSLQILMQLGQAQERVTVEATATLVNTVTAVVSQVVERSRLVELPLNGRMLIDLVLTVPGAHMSHGAATGDMSALYWRPGQRSAVSIGGSRPNANYFLLDGATNTAPSFSTQNLSPSPDAVQEFEVQTGSYSAEMGGAGGGQHDAGRGASSSRSLGRDSGALCPGSFDPRAAPSHSF